MEISDKCLDQNLDRKLFERETSGPLRASTLHAGPNDVFFSGVDNRQAVGDEQSIKAKNMSKLQFWVIRF